MYVKKNGCMKILLYSLVYIKIVVERVKREIGIRQRERERERVRGKCATQKYWLFMWP